MIRLLVLFLALLLPLQFAWAGAAEYCQHEAEPAAALHLGHHEHRHEGASDGKTSAGGKWLLDADCNVCHAAGAPLIAGSTTVAPLAALAGRAADLTAPPPASAPSRAPDRPQWSRLA